jgi:hypothetical protein
MVVDLIFLVTEAFLQQSICSNHPAARAAFSREIPALRPPNGALA